MREFSWLVLRPLPSYLQGADTESTAECPSNVCRVFLCRGEGETKRQRAREGHREREREREFVVWALHSGYGLVPLVLGLRSHTYIHHRELA